MPLITIIPSDKVMLIDRLAMIIDECEGLKDDGKLIHAVQWNGSKGWIEYQNDPFDNQNFIPNKLIDDFKPFQHLIPLWNAAKQKWDEAVKEAAEFKLKVETEALARKMQEEEAMNAKTPTS